MATKIITVMLTEEEIADVKEHCEEDWPTKSWGTAPNNLFADGLCISTFMKVRDAILKQ